MKNEYHFTYCPRCGGALKKQAFNLLLCQTCGFHFYINPKICNAAILENAKGEIFLAKRRYPPYEGYWDLPGGFVDINETLEESTRREIREELGIELGKINYFGSYPDRYLYQEITYHVVSVIFVGKLTAQVVSPGDEFLEIGFFAPKAIPLTKVGFPSLRKALREYMARVS